jgi:hypothetical protein
MVLSIIPSFWEVVLIGQRINQSPRFPVRRQGRRVLSVSRSTVRFITGCLSDSVALVTKGTLPIKCPVHLRTVSTLLVSEFFWGPFRNQHLPWPFLVILMLTPL